MDSFYIRRIEKKIKKKAAYLVSEYPEVQDAQQVGERVVGGAMMSLLSELMSDLVTHCNCHLNSDEPHVYKCITNKLMKHIGNLCAFH